MNKKEIFITIAIVFLFGLILAIQAPFLKTTGKSINFQNLGYGDEIIVDSDEDPYAGCYEEYVGGPYGADFILVCPGDEPPIVPPPNNTLPPGEAIASCSDLDGGENFFKASKVKTLTNKNKEEIFLDYCQDAKTLIEQICIGKTHATELYSCDSCISGACVSSDNGSTGSRIYVASGSKGPGQAGASGAGSLIPIGQTCGSFELKTPVSAKANSVDPEFPASNAIDKDPFTDWFGESESYPKIIELNLGSKKCISYVNLYFSKWDIPMKLDLEISNNGQDWDTVISDLEVSWPRMIHQDLPEISIAKYIRLVETSGKREFGNLAEIEVKSANLI